MQSYVRKLKGVYVWREGGEGVGGRWRGLFAAEDKRWGAKNL